MEVFNSAQPALPISDSYTNYEILLENLLYASNL